MKNLHIAVAGGGIGGLTTAIALQQQGFDAHVFEAAPVLKPVGAGITLAGNAMLAYRALGIDKEILAAGRAMAEARIMLASGRELTATHFGKFAAQYGVTSVAIHRGALHEVLQAALLPGTLHTGCRATGVDTSATNPTLLLDDGRRMEADVVIAADGIHSPIRQQLMPHAKLRYSGQTCWRAVVEMPADVVAQMGIMESWGGAVRMGYAPLSDTSVYYFAVKEAAANSPDMRRATPDDLMRWFGHFHAPVPDLLKATEPEQLIWGDINDLSPINKYAFGRVALLGDAAHATTPNMGQGACMAIEDGVVLAQCLATETHSPEAALRQYEALRRPRTQWVVRTSWRIGQMAHWQNPVGQGLRNFAVRHLPAENVMHKLHKVQLVV